ncbi:hypothetical protein PBY51_018451 [Eleginops maclovinus]|uniref:HTH CENPB-type domain-containing protein n=1 Tax=Eleginops maclovinus TaxID=56733 RepID=A0AAN7Y0F4_ELEMC|nr:hypothetical protein PBY51_018451 [Eleginops maclovinus]
MVSQHHSETGSTKRGFVKDRISGAVTVNGVEDSLVGAPVEDSLVGAPVEDSLVGAPVEDSLVGAPVEDSLVGAPVEDVDISENQNLEILQDIEDQSKDIVQTLKRQTSHRSPTRTSPPASRPTICREREDFLTARKEDILSACKEDFLSVRQLRVCLAALCEGLLQASRIFSTKASLILSGLKDARRRLKQTDPDHQNSEGGQHLVVWVLSMREQQIPITETLLFHKASVLKKKGVFRDSFRISYAWALGFMLRHRLGIRTLGRAPTLGLSLPVPLEAKIRSFRYFTQKVIQDRKLWRGSVAAMDELCLFVDLNLVQDRSSRPDALQLTGTLPLVSVYLTVLADGSMLPSLVLSNRMLAEKDLPDYILLEGGQEGLQVEEALDLWTNRVWLNHLSGHLGKSLLVLDRHREHLGDPFLASLSGSKTLPALIPAGCSPRLQPLEVCLKPVLQRFLMSRWIRFISGDPEELEETFLPQIQTSIAQRLVDWLLEALMLLNEVPLILKESFSLTGLLPGGGGIGSPEDIQTDLLRTLTRTLLGHEGLEESSELLELEDQEDEEEPELEEETPKDKLEDPEPGEDISEDKLEDPKPGEETSEDKLEDKETQEETEQEVQDTVKVHEDRKEVKEEREDGRQERRETRIVIGEEVGDEWKITMKSRTDGKDEDS